MTIVQSGLTKDLWHRAMECYCYLRDVRDKVADDRTAYENIFGVPFGGPLIPFGANVSYKAIS